MLKKLNAAFWKKFIAVVAVGGVVVGVLAAGAISLGLMPISARAPHLGITQTVLHYTFKRSTSRVAGKYEAPEDLMSPERVALGIQHYHNVCSSCHGGPDLGQSPIALSMRPRPQHLAAVVDQFSDEQLYVILRNGVKFSAMPYWPADSNYSEIWSLVAFLRTLPDMSAEEYIAATTRTLPEDAVNLPFEPEQPLEDMVVGVLAPPLDEYYYARPGTGWHEYVNNGEIIATCAACHGDDGSGSPTGGLAPNLTLQSADYISKALHGYANGDRPSGIMMTVAASLTDDQIDGLAEYYAGLPDVASPSEEASTGDPEAGGILAMMGKPSEAMPACYTCHQNIEDAATMVVPDLAGQSELYIHNKLNQFATQAWTGGDRWKPMGAVASSLTEQDRADVAAYFAALPIGETAPAIAPLTGNAADAEGLVTQWCAECHTETGVGVSSGAYPNLTIQTPYYLAQQLHAFSARHRDDERMTGVVDELTLQNMTDLALYFGDGPARPTPQPSDTFGTPEEIANGQQIAENGIPDKNIPACLTCHNADTIEELPLVARLHGQAGGYIQSRLQNLGSDTDKPVGAITPMHSIAMDLTTEERHDVAAWFASQPALDK